MLTMSISNDGCNVKWMPNIYSLEYRYEVQCEKSIPEVVQTIQATPTPGQTHTGLLGIVQKIFPESYWYVWEIIRCETGGTFRNDLIGKAGEVSIFQIHPIHFNRFSRERLIRDVEYAVQVAHILYVEAGYSFRPWSCA